MRYAASAFNFYTVTFQRNELRPCSYVRLFLQCCCCCRCFFSVLIETLFFVFIISLKKSGRRACLTKYWKYIIDNWFQAAIISHTVIYFLHSFLFYFFFYLFIYLFIYQFVLFLQRFSKICWLISLPRSGTSVLSDPGALYCPLAPSEIFKVFADFPKIIPLVVALWSHIPVIFRNFTNIINYVVPTTLRLPRRSVEFGAFSQKVKALLQNVRQFWKTAIESNIIHCCYNEAKLFLVKGQENDRPCFKKIQATVLQSQLHLITFKNF